MGDMMRIATGQFNEPTAELLSFAAQMGVSGIVLNTPRLPGEERWEACDLTRLRKRVEDFGLRIESIENVPTQFYDQAMLGTEGAARQIKNYQDTIRSLGEAEIPILGYHWMPNGVWRTSQTTPTRGGALVTAFDMNELVDHHKTHDGDFDEALLWSTYEHFTHAVLPVAEASVRAACSRCAPAVNPNASKLLTRALTGVRLSGGFCTIDLIFRKSRI